MDLSRFTQNSKFLMLALDHRSSFKKLINPEDQVAVSKEEIIRLKGEIIESLVDQFSGLLVDVEYGLPAYKNRTKPYLLPVEKSGYKEVDGERVTELEHTVRELKQLGASGIKLLINFDPGAKTANQQLETAKKIGQDCIQESIPLFLEIVTYGDMPKQDLVIQSVETFLNNNIRPDVFKLEFPGDEGACKKITELLGQIPWILLTAGEDFEAFKLQLVEAIKNGCSGFLAGRALWKELFQFQHAEKEKFLKEILPSRFREIAIIVTNNG